MRRIQKKHSTKFERVLYEILKELGEPFRHRWIVEGREVDFIVGKLAIEIDGHEQSPEKNNMLVQMGYVPVHFHNKEILTNREIIKYKIKCLLE
jgi:very-short-patch-repair endonuclease